MRPDQGEAILVLVDLLDGNVPAPYVVALFAVGSELAAMDVGMTIRGFAAHIREHHFDVALRAGDALVHAAQRVASLIVVKLRSRPDRLPPRSGLAPLTGNAQICVRAVSFAIGLSLPALWSTRGQEHQPEDDVQ